MMIGYSNGGVAPGVVNLAQGVAPGVVNLAQGVAPGVIDLGVHAVEESGSVPPYGRPQVDIFGLGRGVAPGVVNLAQAPGDASVVEALQQFVEVERGQARSLRMIAIWTSVMGALTVAGITASVLIAILAPRRMSEAQAEEAA